MPPPANTSRYFAREFLASQTIALEASDSNRAFHVREHLLRSISPVLLAAVDGQWKEQTTRRYKFHGDVTEQVLLYFLIWAYHEKSNAQRLTVKKSEQKKTHPEGQAAKVSAEVLVNGHVEGPAKGEQEDAQTTEAPEELHPLLLHIKLYVFAEMYMIEPLKALSMQKMIAQLKELGNLKEGYERAAVFDVLIFAFSSRLPQRDVLLHWLARYASWKLDELKQMPSEFENLLLETDGNFATLLVRYVQKSSIVPFDLRAEEIMPQYPISNTRR